MSPVSPSSTVLFVRLVGIARNGNEGNALRQIHELDPHCVPVPRPPHRLHRSSDNTAIGRYREQLIVRANNDGADQSATTFGDLCRQDALAATPLNRVLVKGRAFGVSTAS